MRDDKLLLEVCRSSEQGVQRLGFDLVPDLLIVPPNEDIVRELAQIASGTDDVGIPRRLVLAHRQGPHSAMTDVLLNAIARVEEGVRRRAFEVVEENGETASREWWTSDLAWFTRCDQRVMLNAR